MNSTYLVQVHDGESWQTVRECDSRAEANRIASTGGLQEHGPVRVTAGPDTYVESTSDLETATAIRWVNSSRVLRSEFWSAYREGDDCVREYLERIQRTRFDLDVPRFTVARVCLHSLAVASRRTDID